MPILQKRLPLAGALLIATSALALSSCVSEKKALDSAAVAPAATQAQAPQLAAQFPTRPTTHSQYRDPMVANVAAPQPMTVADPNVAVAPQAAAVDPSAPPPANSLGNVVMQSTHINAQAMSIFSERQAVPQNNNSSTLVQPSGVNAYAPTGSSVYGTPDASGAQQQAQPILPQQSSQNLDKKQAQVQTAALTSGISATTMSALYTAPKENLLSSLSGLLQKASLPGMTRIAPNGLHVQTDNVQVACFKPNLLKVIKTVESHFGRPVVVTSGYRDPEHNRQVGGAEESMHMSCDAADIQIDGVSKWDIAAYIRSLPGRGGVGTYCHTDSIHLDTGNNRDWNWGCSRRAPITNARAI